MSLENRFDTEFVATLSYREKQMQQSYRPIIGVHKWFARRPGTLFRSLMLAEFDDTPLSTSFYQAHDFSEKVIADPFMGGGTPLIEANRLGMGTIGADINPMAYWVVRQSLAELDLFTFKLQSQKVAKAVESDLGHLFKTDCTECGNEADVKYFLRTKEESCINCGEVNALFPSYKISSNQRHPDYVWFCPDCGKLTEVSEQPSGDNSVSCSNCASVLPHEGNSSGKSFDCRYCGESQRYRDRDEAMEDRIIAIEYHCGLCSSSHEGRFFKAPDKRDFTRDEQAATLLEESEQEYIPEDNIPEGDETSRLHNWGYKQYRDLFTDRQLVTLNRLAKEIVATDDDEIRRALATVFSDSLRYQNMLCRYDSWALKIQDIFSVHGFPAGLVRAENNVIGIPGIGSGSFRHFVEKYERAKKYAKQPTEATFGEDGKKTGSVQIGGERIGADFAETPDNVCGGQTYLLSGDSRNLGIKPESLDGVFTDPPYFDNLQYSELMDFCYVWLKQLLPDIDDFNGNGGSTRKPEELTVNKTQNRGLLDFTQGLSGVFSAVGKGLKEGAPLVFTYHHNDPEAYIPVIVAILDAGLNCTGDLAAPAEMSASLHISGTGSSIVDTIFVCRDEAVVLDEPLQELLPMVEQLRDSGLDISEGDLRCISMGHIAQRTINKLYEDWDRAASISDRVSAARTALNGELQDAPVDSLVTDIKECLADTAQDGHAIQGGAQ